MGRKKKSQTDDIPNIIFTDEPKTKQQRCRVLWIRKNKFAISINNSGVTIQGIIDPSTKEVSITYKGTFGKPDFKIVSYK